MNDIEAMVINLKIMREVMVMMNKMMMTVRTLMNDFPLGSSVVASSIIFNPVIVIVTWYLIIYDIDA